jgi:hypothetical protein
MDRNRTYTMGDGLVVKTKNARHSWHFESEMLYVTRRGKYWMEFNFARAEYMDNHAAARWLNARGFELPADLAGLGG